MLTARVLLALQFFQGPQQDNTFQDGVSLAIGISLLYLAFKTFSELENLH